MFVCFVALLVCGDLRVVHVYCVVLFCLVDAIGRCLFVLMFYFAVVLVVSLVSIDVCLICVCWCVCLLLCDGWFGFC